MCVHVQIYRDRYKIRILNVRAAISVTNSVRKCGFSYTYFHATQQVSDATRYLAPANETYKVAETYRMATRFPTPYARLHRSW